MLTCNLKHVVLNYNLNSEKSRQGYLSAVEIIFFLHTVQNILEN